VSILGNVTNARYDGELENRPALLCASLDEHSDVTAIFHRTRRKFETCREHGAIISHEWDTNGPIMRVFLQKSVEKNKTKNERKVKRIKKMSE